MGCSLLYHPHVLNKSVALCIVLWLDVGLVSYFCGASGYVPWLSCGGSQEEGWSSVGRRSGGPPKTSPSCGVSGYDAQVPRSNWCAQVPISKLGTVAKFWVSRWEQCDLVFVWTYAKPRTEDRMKRDPTFQTEPTFFPGLKLTWFPGGIYFEEISFPSLSRYTRRDECHCRVCLLKPNTQVVL